MCLFLAVIIFLFFALCWLVPALTAGAVIMEYWYIPVIIIGIIFVGAFIYGLVQGIEDGKEWKEKNK